MPSGLQKYVKHTLRLLIPGIIALYALSCATIVTPTGGPKDIVPPKLISSQPVNHSTNFTGNKLILDFDEYISLKTPEKFLLISPPLSQLPDIKVKGHSLLIKIGDSLRRNTTYNFYLGDAIVDLNEGNPLTNFNFSFSTGPQIDSLSLSGNVTDAFTRMPVKGALVLLYSDFTDSMPMKQIPTYVSRTNDEGKFVFNSLASGKFRAIALTDGNNDYMYNLPTEMIGFSNDSVEPYYNAIVTIKDSTAAKKDSTSVKNDSLMALKAEALYPLLALDLFPEPDSTQRVVKSTIVAINRLAVFFRYPTVSPVFRALNAPDSLPWAVTEWNRTNDTLNAWLLNKPDTLHLEITDRGLILDTIVISTTMKVVGKPKKTDASPKLKFTHSAMGGRLEYGSPLYLTFSNPVKKFNAGSIVLKSITGKDTTIIKPVVQFTDSIHRRLSITNKWDANSRYDLYLPEGSIAGMYDDGFDSTHVFFTMKPIDDYGKFAVSLNRKDESYPVILQLLTEKGAFIDQRIVSKGRRADFGLLPPGKYGLKAILDTNANGRWDTGILLKKIQPERVLVHPKQFDVRTNWELEETWDL